MTKEFEMTDDTVQNQGRQTRERSVDRQQKVEGKALRINENSIEDRESSASPSPPEQRTGDRPKPHRVEGKALRVNDNSVGDQEPAGSSVPPHRE